jgi:hypothetical protein
VHVHIQIFNCYDVTISLRQFFSCYDFFQFQTPFDLACLNSIGCNLVNPYYYTLANTYIIILIAP